MNDYELDARVKKAGENYRSKVGQKFVDLESGWKTQKVAGIVFMVTGAIVAAPVAAAKFEYIKTTVPPSDNATYAMLGLGALSFLTGAWLYRRATNWYNHGIKKYVNSNSNQKPDEIKE